MRQFSEFDSKTADLDLIVLSSLNNHISVGKKVAVVAGAI